MNKSILSKIELPPFGIRKRDGGWRVLNQKDSLSEETSAEIIYPIIHELCVNESKINNKIEEFERNCYDDLFSIETANYIKMHQPNLKLEDISLQIGLTLFTHIVATHIDCHQWLGGNAGSVHYDYDQAKKRTVCEVLERIYLNQNGKCNIWSSAIAPSPQMAQKLARIEALERWVTMKFWQRKEGYDVYECIDLSQDELLSAISFEWEKYKAEMTCVSLNNPFGIRVALAKIIVNFNNRLWTFYGNGCGENKIIAAQKACLESLQFIPGRNVDLFDSLEHSNEPSIKRVMQWSQDCKFGREFIPTGIFKPAFLEDLDFSTRIENAFNSINIEITIEKIDNIDIYISYTTAKCKNWWEIEGIPIA